MTIYVYQLRAVVIHKKILLDPIPMHMICWLIPLLQALLPLSTQNTFGTDNDGAGHHRCGYSGNQTNEYIWLAINSVTGLLLFCLMLFWLSEMKKHTQKIKDKKIAKHNADLASNLLLLQNNAAARESALNSIPSIIRGALDMHVCLVFHYFFRNGPLLNGDSRYNQHER